MSMKYAYRRAGGPILDWRTGPPPQSRAADAVALGSLGGSSLSQPTLVLPAPGAPEPIGVSRAMSGCSCRGSCGCGMSGVESIPGGWITVGIGAYLLWRLMGKPRSRDRVALLL
jgi:hypothetical protein